MEFRHLGRSGLKISALTYGNWITHGSQVDDTTAHATIHAALDAGITTFDTADVYAGTRAEEVMGAALRGQRREGVEIFTKVYWPTGPGVNDRGLSRKPIMESCEASLRRLQTDYVDLYQAHRYDYSTPLEETLRAFDDLVRQGKVLYVGVSEWTADEIREATRIAADMGFDRIISNQPQYSMLYRVIEAEVVPACEELGIGQIVWSPMAQGVLTGVLLSGFFFAHKVGQILVVRSQADPEGRQRAYTVLGQVFFASADRFVNAFDYKEVIEGVQIDVSRAHLWDITAVSALDKVVLKFRREGTEVEVIGLNEASATLVDRFALHDKDGADDLLIAH